MQASQSNNAADLPQSHPAPGPPSESVLAHNIPSPSSAPIKAATKYLERQRCDAWEIGTKAEQGTFERGTYGQGSPDQDTRERSIREQDRRLERSLYEGQSIEAGLNYEETDLDLSQANSREDRVYLVDGDGCEAMFPYAVPSSMPSAEAVRGAIFRLARASEFGRTQFTEGRQGGTGGSSELKESTPLPAFEDVARRLWEASPMGGYGQALHMETTEASTSGEAVRRRDSPSFRLHVNGIDMHSAGSSASQGIAPQLPDTKTLGQAETLPGVSVCCAEEEAALAHDACNLLSALGLYADLLGVSGVLPEQHRHYADELKLMARRSQALIERLLRAAETAKVRAVSPATPGEGAASVARDGDLESTSLVDLLMRWGSLLSTLAHGTLEVAFGRQASTPVPAAAEALERILVNLVRNARAATVAGGAIRISVALDQEAVPDWVGRVSNQRDGSGPGNTVVLTVDDSGCGMTEAQVQQLLADQPEQEAGARLLYEAEQETSDGYGRWPGKGRYVREAPSRIGVRDVSEAGLLSPYPRRGLGMKIVRGLVTASGGTLSIQSWPGRGTRIEVRWPVTVSPSSTQPRESQSLQRVESTQTEEALGMKSERYSGTENMTAIRGATKTVSRETTSEARQAARGPDGFSEAELQEMMLRMHRPGPNERISPNQRLTGRRRFGFTSAKAGKEEEARRGGTGTQKSKADKDGTNDSNGSSKDLKGAIAC